jgi:hypothetical protein
MEMDGTPRDGRGRPWAFITKVISRIEGRKIMDKRKMKVVIIGGVATGPKAAARLRRLNPEAEITIVERGKILSYAGCGMPYYVSGDIADYRSLNSTPSGIPRDSVFFRNVKNINVLDRTLARSIDRKNKTVDIVISSANIYLKCPAICSILTAWKRWMHADTVQGHSSRYVNRSFGFGSGGYPTGTSPWEWA